MKTILTSYSSALGVVVAVAVAVCGAAPPMTFAANETAEQLGVLPNQKAPLLVTATERNPFADRTGDGSEDLFTLSSESQESQIRKVFANLFVNGISERPDGKRVVLLSDMILQEGRNVPPVIAGQTEMLIVSKITEKEIELSWVDGDSKALDGRKLTIPFLMEPSVEFELKGQPAGEGQRPARAVKMFPREQAAEDAKDGDKVISLATPLSGPPERPGEASVGNR